MVHAEAKEHVVQLPKHAEGPPVVTQRMSFSACRRGGLIIWNGQRQFGSPLVICKVEGDMAVGDALLIDDRVEGAELDANRILPFGVFVQQLFFELLRRLLEFR